MVKLKKIYPPERYEKFTDIKFLVEASAEKYGAKTLFKYFGPEGLYLAFCVHVIAPC